MNKIYNFSITTGTEEGTCIISELILGKDIYFAEFTDFRDASDFLYKCFKMIGTGKDYCAYIRRGD